ncbi:MAG: hypothetical protein WCW44_05890 [archaeon]|jgi:hypothetical protein
MLTQKETEEVVYEEVLGELIGKISPYLHARGIPPMETRRIAQAQAAPTAKRISNSFFTAKKASTYPQGFTPELLYRTIQHTSASNIKELEKILRVNMKVAKNWLGWQKKTVNFTLQSCFVPYTESPLGFEVLYRGIRIATIGGFIDKRNGELTAVINNLQGVSPKIIFEEAKRNPSMRYRIKSPEDASLLMKLLDKELGPHFRLNLTRFVTQGVKEKLKIRMELDPPVRKGAKTEADYALRLKRYRQTAIEAGFKQSKTPTRSVGFIARRKLRHGRK